MEIYKNIYNDMRKRILHIWGEIGTKQKKGEGDL